MAMSIDVESVRLMFGTYACTSTLKVKTDWQMALIGSISTTLLLAL